PESVSPSMKGDGHQPPFLERLAPLFQSVEKADLLRRLVLLDEILETGLARPRIEDRGKDLTCLVRREVRGTCQEGPAAERLNRPGYCGIRSRRYAGDSLHCRKTAIREPVSLHSQAQKPTAMIQRSFNGWIGKAGEEERSIDPAILAGVGK